jgi:PAS domain S-box-containing protein
MVAATVRKGENKPLWSMVAINSKPRRWTPDEVQLVEEVAERTWTAIQRAKGEEALRQNEEKYRTLFNSIDEGFQLYEVLYDNTGKPVDFRYLETNPAFEQQTGLKNVAGKLGSEVIPNLESYWFDYFEEILKSPEPLHTENYHEATGRWYSASSFRAFNDGRLIIGALFTDITERKLREQQLAKDLADTTQLQQVSSAFLEAKDSDSLYRKIMDAAQAIMQSDMASIQVFVPEKNALKLIGYKNFHPESARLWEWVEADTGSVWGLALTENKRVIVPDIETEFIKDADALHVHGLSGIRAVQSTPLISRSGKIIGMFSTHWTKIHEPSERDLRLLDVLARQAGDLIEKKQAEDALRQSEEKLKQFNIQLEQQVKERTQELNEKNKQLQHTVSQLESFNYIASHDLQEPLRKIQTFVELLNENEISDAEKQEYLAGLNVSSARMSDLINSLLQYSRLSRARDAFQPVDLNITLLNVKTDYEIAINEKHGIIESDHLPTVPAIPFQMHQLFANLISNSLKFCERQPQINISSRIVAGNEIKTENQLNDKIKYAELIFRDNGIGFDNKYSKKIFEVFQRLHNQSAYNGTGIGLSIVHKIVKQHNGFIKAEGEKERGSVFTVYLPVV